ncbi:MAG: hypothetical protein ACRDSE_02425 [Pseudonocardiaceae bacterium]
MIVVDIAADLNDEDDTGLVWTFLDEARNPAIVGEVGVIESSLGLVGQVYVA